jgi:hypothetical protein
MSVRHIFMWSVDGEENGAMVLKALSRLPEKVAGLDNWAIGQHIGDMAGQSVGRTFDYALTVDFDDLDELRAYQEHPAHQAVVEQVMPYYSDWAVVDLDLSVGIR